MSEGLVSNLARPSGNVTGITVPTTSLNEKRLEILNQLVPRGDVIAVLANPGVSWTDVRAKDLQTAARVMGRNIHVVTASHEREIDPAVQSVAALRAAALLVSADPLFNGQLHKLVDLTQRYRLPAIFEWREFATAGGLMSYGSDIANGLANSLTVTPSRLCSCASSARRVGSASAAKVRSSGSVG